MRRVAVVTGTRAEWGLLRPVCTAIQARDDLALEIYAGGAHLLAPAMTIDEVRAFAAETHEFSMQQTGATGRAADAHALARGMASLSNILEQRSPDVVVVLGDRIEAFAAACSASIGGIRVAHIHGGDRAEGVADEAMRHAITKLAHIHFPATRESAHRLERMGEEVRRIHCTGSPAIDGIAAITPLSDARYQELGSPEFVFLLHACGRDARLEEHDATVLLDAVSAQGRVLALAPNSDAGREGVVTAITAAHRQVTHVPHVMHVPHLPRNEFIGLLRRKEVRALVGNSSAGLIEAAALGVRALNVGTRQGGRERADNVVDVECVERGLVTQGLSRALELSPSGAHPYGDGDASARIAAILASYDLREHSLAKRNSY